MENTLKSAPTPLPDLQPPARSLLWTLRTAIGSLTIPLLSIFTALVIGSILILIAGQDPVRAFNGLFQGALGTDRGLTVTLNRAAPLILAGLSVAFAFKGGLFNIGAQGQVVVGALLTAWVGFAVNVPPLPVLGLDGRVLQTVVHVVIVLFAGAIGGMLWGMIPGILKARTGAHEVISTIMLNYIAANLIEWAVAPVRAAAAAGPLAECTEIGGCAISRTPSILDSARLPLLYIPGGRATENLHIGILIAVAAAILIFIVLYRTTFGFELRMVGTNPGAARYSGIKVARMTVITMMIAGALSGLAGAVQTSGVFFYYQTNQNLGLGFNSISVALLASSNPIGIIPAALLFGIFEAGASQMQFASKVPTEIIQVVQALILMFVAADQIIRQLYRVRVQSGDDKVKLSTGWGQR